MSSVDFIQQLYSRFLGRRADDAGVRYWSDVLDNRLASAAEVTQQFLASTEFTAAIEPVARLYLAAFGRIPDAAGLAYWIERAQAGTPLGQIAQAFAASAEFGQRYGSLGNEDFLGALYLSALGRPVERVGGGWWKQALDSGSVSRAEVLRALADSAEMRAASGADIRVIAMYHGTVGTAPTRLQLDAAHAAADPLAQITALYADQAYRGAAVPGLPAVPGNLVEGSAPGGGATAISTDTVAPVLTMSSPTFTASTATLTLTFSEAIQKGSGVITLTNGVSQYFLSNGSLVQRFAGETHKVEIDISENAVSVSGTTLSVTIAAGLKELTTYSVLIDQGAIQDLNGNAFAGMPDTTSMHFSTGTAATNLAAPALLAEYDTGISASDGYTTIATFKVRGDGVSPNSTVKIYNWGTEVGTAVANGSGQWESGLLSLGTGGHGITFREVDSNSIPVGTTSSILSVNVNTAAPYISITDISDDNGPVDGDLETNDNTPTIQGIADYRSTVHVLVDGVEVGTAVPSIHTGHWEYALGAKPDASYAISAYAVSLAGVTGTTFSAWAPLVIDTVAPTGSTAAPQLHTSSDTGISSTDQSTKESLPMFEGSGGPANGYVRLYNGSGQEIGTGYVDAGGNYFAWVSSDNPLTHGEHTVHVRFEDKAGNLSAATSTVTIDVDLQAPTATAGAASLDSASDTGTAGDNVTRMSNPTFKGTAPAGQLVLITVQDHASAYAVADSSGNWSSNEITFFTRDEYDVIVTHVDNAGNLGPPSSAYTLTIDPQALTANLITLVDDSGLLSWDEVTSDSTPRISGTGENGSTIRLKIDGTEVTGVTTTVVGGAWTLTLPEKVDGEYSVVVFATDAYGHSSADSSSMTIKIDTVAPATVTTAPVLASSDDTGFSDSDNTTKKTEVTVSGTGAEVDAKVVIYDAGTEIAHSFVQAGGTWSVFLSTLSHNVHALTAKFFDAAGNISAVTNSLALTVDTQIPTGTAATPSLQAASDTGSANITGSLSDGVTSNAVVVLTGAAPDGQRVHIKIDGSYFATAVSSGGAWTYSWDRSLTPFDFVYQVSAVYADDAGNESATASGDFRLEFDATEPAPSAPTLLDDTSIESMQDITNDATPRITGSYAEDGAFVELMEGSTVLGTATVSGGTYTITPSTLSGSSPDGDTHELKVKVTDKAGNSGYSSLLYITVDTTAPSAVTAVTPVQGDFDYDFSATDLVTGDATPVFSGAVSGAGWVYIFSGSTEIAKGQASGGIFTTGASTATLAPGTHSLTAKMIDHAGNEASSFSFSITVDTEAPATAPGTPFLDTSSQTGSSTTSTSDNTPLLKGTGTEGERVLVFMDGATLDAVVATVTVSSGYWSYMPALAEGTYAYRVAYVDSAGNVGPLSTAFSVTVDTTAPQVTLALTNEGGSLADNDDDLVTTSGSHVFSGTAPAGETVTIYINSSPVDTVVAASNGTFSYTTSQSVDFSISATVANDSAGNVAVDADLDIDVDDVAPDISSDGAGTNVSTSLQIDFAEDVYWDGSDSFEILSGGVAVRTIGAADASWSGHGTVTLNWASALADGTYTIRAPASIQDGAGNLIYGRTAPLTIDTVAPTISNHSVTASTLILTMSEGVEISPSAVVEIYLNGTLTRTLYDDDLVVAGSVSVNGTNGLPAGTYVAVFSNAIIDLVGNPLATHSTLATGLSFTIT